MQDLTMPVEEHVLAAAQAAALKRETTVGDLVRNYLVKLGEEARLSEARKELLALVDSTTGRLDPGFKWNREDVYAERMFPRHEHSGLPGPPR